MIEIGRVCVKTAGREAGRKCVVIDTIDDTYVMITGPKALTKVKRRKCNIVHLEPLEDMLKIVKNAGDPEVEKALKEGNVIKAPAKPAKAKAEKAEKPAEKPKEKKGLRARLSRKIPGKEGAEPAKAGKTKETQKPAAKTGKAKK